MQLKILFKLPTLIIAIIFIAGLVFSMFPTTAHADSLNWLTGWNYRKKITISNTNVTADLSNFPVLVKITADADLSTALATGYDMRFTDLDGSTLLKYERESWTGGNGTAGSGVFWVKVPTITTTTNTEIYMYYGKSDATDGQDAINVWDSNFRGVYHFSNGVTLNGSDSTLNGNNGVVNGMVATNGVVDGAAANDGTISKYISIFAPNYQTDTEGTLSSWFYVTSNSDRRSIFMHMGDAPNASRNTLEFYTHTDGTALFRMYGHTAAQLVSYVQSPTAIQLNAWHNTTVTVDRATNKTRMYVDGSEVSNADYSAWFNDILNPDPYTGRRYFFVGSSKPNVNGNYIYPMQGSIDEIRISDFARSSSWIKFEYNNVNSSNNEITFSSQQDPPAPTPTNLTTSLDQSTRTITVSVDTFTNSTQGSSGYYFTSSSGNNSGWIQTNTWQDTNLACGTNYSYTVKYRNADAIETTTVSTTQATTTCAGGNLMLLNLIKAKAQEPQTPQPPALPKTMTPEQKQILIAEIKAKIAELVRQLIIMLQKGE